MKLTPARTTLITAQLIFAARLFRTFIKVFPCEYGTNTTESNIYSAVVSSQKERKERKNKGAFIYDVMAFEGGRGVTKR